MEAQIKSRPYSPSMACEACVFGKRDHAPWCRATIVARVQAIARKKKEKDEE